MAVIIDEVTAEIQSAPPPASGGSPPASERSSGTPESIEVVRVLELLGERAARLSAD